MIKAFSVEPLRELDYAAPDSRQSATYPEHRQTKKRTSMMKSTQRYLIAALILLSVVSLPRLSYAGSLAYGTLTGVADVLVSEWVDNQLVGGFGGSNLPATFSFSLDTSTDAVSFSIENAVFPIAITGTILMDQPFGITPHSAFAAAIGQVSHVGPQIGEFSVTFQSIARYGLIDPTNATVYAGYYFPDLDPSITGEIISAYFHTVQEPSSFVMAAAGALMILV